MTRLAGKRYWLVGASEGLGRELAIQLDKLGASLVLSARSADRLNDLAQDLSHADVVPVDVTQSADVKRAAAEAGRLDGVIFNAGAYDPMPTQKWDTDVAIRMTDVNYLGALRVLGEVVPEFVARGEGDITLVGSLSGYRGLPKAIGYGASKAAMISLAETMRFDLKNTGATVRVVNPGFIRTRLTDKNTFKMPQLMEPDEAAAHIVRAMQKRKFRTDFPAPFAWGIRLFNLLPDWMIYRGK